MGSTEDAPVVEIASDHVPNVWVRLSALPVRYSDPNFTRLRVEAGAGDAVRCASEVAMGWIAGIRPGGMIDDWFQALADDWRRWEGERSWLSLENGLLIRARHLANRVVLRFRLQPDAREPEWRVQVAIPVDPGEQLAAIAWQMKRLRPSYGRQR